MKAVAVFMALVAGVALAFVALVSNGGARGLAAALAAPPERGGPPVALGSAISTPAPVAVAPQVRSGVRVVDPAGPGLQGAAPALVLGETTAAPDMAPPGSPGAAAPPPPAPAGTRAALAAGWGPLPAPDLDPRPFSEAHWQGLEAIPKTAPLVEALGLPADVDGVILDDVTLPADLQGFRAGDLVTAIDGFSTPNLMRFIQATDRVRDQNRTTVDLVRAGVNQRIDLVALFERLGTANGETPAMIPPGARSPHPYQGPCLGCHRIGTTGSLATDQGDPVRGPPPPIRVGNSPPHRDRGPCVSCHRILP